MLRRTREGIRDVVEPIPILQDGTILVLVYPEPKLMGVGNHDEKGVKLALVLSKLEFGVTL